MTINWSEGALNDLRDIKAWIARDSECYALRVVERIIERVSGLQAMPGRGHRVPESPDENIREIHSDPYRIIYQVQSDAVGILAIAHMARQVSMDENSS